MDCSYANRLVIADWFGIDQKSFVHRLYICVPLLGAGALISQLNYNVIWRYFSWSNQTLAMIALWVSTSYLMQNSKNCWYSLITAIPGVFMSAVSMTYILMAKEGFRLSSSVAYPVGIVFAVLCILFAFMAYGLNVQNPWVPFAFLTGGLFSGLAGFFGMKTATYASARTANAARESLNAGLKIAFRSGAVMGLTVVGLGLLDIPRC